MKEENLRLRDHDKEELSHYSNATTDFEFLFPFGWGELWGVADRTDYDLNAHQEHSGGEHGLFRSGRRTRSTSRTSLSRRSAQTALHWPSCCDAYDEEEVSEGDIRVVLHLHPALAPYKAAVLPLSKKLSEKAGEVLDLLAKDFIG